MVEFLPKETNTLVKIYNHLKTNDVLFLQRWLWDFDDLDVRAGRARDMVIAAAEVMAESSE